MAAAKSSSGNREITSTHARVLNRTQPNLWLLTMPALFLRLINLLLLLLLDLYKYRTCASCKSICNHEIRLSITREIHGAHQGIHRRAPQALDGRSEGAYGGRREEEGSASGETRGGRHCASSGESSFGYRPHPVHPHGHPVCVHGGDALLPLYTDADDARAYKNYFWRVLQLFSLFFHCYHYSS